MTRAGDHAALLAGLIDLGDDAAAPHAQGPCAAHCTPGCTPPRAPEGARSEPRELAAVPAG